MEKEISHGINTVPEHAAETQASSRFLEDVQQHQGSSSGLMGLDSNNALNMSVAINGVAAELILAPIAGAGLIMKGFRSSELREALQDFQQSGIKDKVSDAYEFGRGVLLRNGEDELLKGPPPESQLKNGDIVFQSSKGGQGDGVMMATHSPFTHTGILFSENGKWVVYEAVQPVKKTPLEQFKINGDDGNYVVRRLKDAETTLTEQALDKMQNYLESNLGKRYDYKFGWGDDLIYCSELVWKAYNEATGKELGEPKKMGDYDLSNPLLKQAIIERWGPNLPLNEKMIGPSDVYESDLLMTVH